MQFVKLRQEHQPWKCTGASVAVLPFNKTSKNNFDTSFSILYTILYFSLIVSLNKNFFFLDLFFLNKCNIYLYLKRYEQYIFLNICNIFPIFLTIFLSIITYFISIFFFLKIIFDHLITILIYKLFNY